MNGLHSLVLVVIFAAGCVIGRWLHRCVLLFPRHPRLADQLCALRREHGCRSCATLESGVQHVPVVSWFVAGRCRNCGRRADIRRPVVELLTGVLLTLLYWMEIPNFSDVVVTAGGLWSPEGPRGPEAIESLWSPMVWLHLRYLLHAVMLCGLIVATVIDFELRIIPDGCTVPGIVFAVLFSFAAGQVHIVPLWFQDVSTTNMLRDSLPELLQPLVFDWNAVEFSRQHPHWHGLLVSVVGLIVGAASIWFVRVIGFWALRQEAMGAGDVVLMALIGAAVGWQPVLVVFFVAPLLAIFVAVGMWLFRRDRDIPYGPWLSIATLLLLLAWRPVWPYAKRIFDMGPALFVMGLLLLIALATTLYLMQILKRILGIAGPVSGMPDDWTSADHLSYYGSERPDEQNGQWLVPMWPGRRSGRGLLQIHIWRGK